MRIDEPKVVPLALGPGVVGAIATGFIAWGTKTGGYPGLEGAYALGHAEITPWMQLAGVAVDMAIAGIPCLLICLFFEKTTGLRVTEAEELAGLDATFWGLDNYGSDGYDDAVAGRADGVDGHGRVPVAPGATPPSH
jgi:Amt family ammonium transporter